MLTISAPNTSTQSKDRAEHRDGLRANEFGSFFPRLEIIARRISQAPGSLHPLNSPTDNTKNQRSKSEQGNSIKLGIAPLSDSVRAIERSCGLRGIRRMFTDSNLLSPSGPAGRRPCFFELMSGSRGYGIDCGRGPPLAIEDLAAVCISGWRGHKGHRDNGAVSTRAKDTFR